MESIPAHQGLLAHLIRSVRPDLYGVIRDSGRIETALVGLGTEGTRHAGLMLRSGTCIVAGVAPARGGECIQETIPVYNTMTECLDVHPNLAAVSIWRHFSSARDAALETIEAGVPVVLLITEGIPLRDIRDVLAAARRRGILLLGGNTPGCIFPPERVKIGMLPDIFHPSETAPGRAGVRGVTILSRSGAILYHISDALASAGIGQNGVLGVGGDGAVGTTFRDLVPLVMEHEATDLVVVAGEIGSAQEEGFAEEVRENPGRFPKPVITLLSGARAPAGKTMGHAGAIVAAGNRYGSFESKKGALEAAGIMVVNSQRDLIAAVRDALEGKTYFDVSRYYERMREIWEAPPELPSWGTCITLVEPNRIVVAGLPLGKIIGKNTLLEASHLLLNLELPKAADLRPIEATADAAARLAAPQIPGNPLGQLSTTLARFFLTDAPASGSQVERTAGALGRTVRYLAATLGNRADLDSAPPDASFGSLLYRAINGADMASPERERLFEALAVASVDHGVTSPSAQATILAASVRAPFEMCLASGLGAITDIHGGAGAEAAKFFLACVERSQKEGVPLDDATVALLVELGRAGLRVPGMGHRIHSEDPRRNALWRMADQAGCTGPCVEISQKMEVLLEEARGFRLPINVDGVIGAIVADLGHKPVAAKAIFILGRLAGLSAHYFEELRTQSPMRRVRFEEAVYRGPGLRSF